MANPTTYFGWVMPTATDLVTDLPADFNVFGQGVDTSLQDLLGGTTGQVLSKTSNTNMDFTWVTPTDQTPLTTKGDLFTFSTVDARLGVGTNGQTLVADSSTSTGLKWAAPTGGGKVLQVVSTTYSTSTAIASVVLTDTGLTLNITPTAATSKILVLVDLAIHSERTSNSWNTYGAIIRGSTNIYDLAVQELATNGGGLFTRTPMIYLDSPATTSATTYKVQIRCATTANSQQSTAQYTNRPSSITLLEIGA